MLALRVRMKKVKGLFKQVHLLPRGIPPTNENIKIWAELETRLFVQKRDPLLGIQTFLYSRQARIDVPESILDWLSACLQQYWNGNGRRSLDRIMRLSPRRFKIAMIKQRDEMLLMDVMRLNATVSNSCLPQKWFCSACRKQNFGTGRDGNSRRLGWNR